MARLLIIDDEKSLCQVLEIAFRKKGHMVETVSNGQAAKKKIESQVYDLIISDIRMPDLSGIRPEPGSLPLRCQDRHAGGGARLDG
jgi:DNA-binding NtrC family response regulator